MSQDEVIASVTIHMHKSGNLEVRAPRDLLLVLGMLEVAKVQVITAHEDSQRKQATPLITLPKPTKGAQ